MFHYHKPSSTLYRVKWKQGDKLKATALVQDGGYGNAQGGKK